MAIEYKSSNTKAELLELATTNGVKVDESMTKTQVISALDAHNATDGAETSEGVNIPKTETQPAEGVQDGTHISAQSAEAPATTNDTAENEAAAQSSANGVQGALNDYDMFVYIGPSLPGGGLKENAVFRGTFEDVMKYLSDVLEKYPQAEKLVVPANRLATFSAKVKTPGNIAHKYYNDIVSATHNHKEV